MLTVSYSLIDCLVLFGVSLIRITLLIGLLLESTLQELFVGHMGLLNLVATSGCEFALEKCMLLLLQHLDH